MSIIGRRKRNTRNLIEAVEHNFLAVKVKLYPNSVETSKTQSEHPDPGDSFSAAYKMRSNRVVRIFLARESEKYEKLEFLHSICANFCF